MDRAPSRSPRTHAALCLFLFAAALGAGTMLACTEAASMPSEANVSDGIEIEFSRMYTAIDGTHDFRVPAIVNGVKSVKWSASDTSMVDLEPGSDGKSVTITARKAGTVTIVAKSGSLRGTAELTIVQATAEEWGYGSDRYNNGVALVRPRGPEGGTAADGGRARPERQPPNPSLACTNCHANGKQDVEHTPMQTAGYSDDELVAIFTRGEKPEGAEMRVMKNRSAWSSMHKWTMETEEVRGIVVYLRSLEPKSQGEVDFGGRRQGPPPEESAAQ